MEILPQIFLSNNNQMRLVLLFLLFLFSVSCRETNPAFSASTTKLTVCANSAESCSTVFSTDVEQILVFGELEKSVSHPIAISIDLIYDNTIVGYKVVKDVTDHFSALIEPSSGRFFNKGNYKVRIMAGRNFIDEIEFEIR